MASDTVIRLEVEGQKFWEITQTGACHTVRFGKIGTAGQTRTKEFDSEEATLKDVQKLVSWWCSAWEAHRVVNNTGCPWSAGGLTSSLPPRS